MPKRITGVTQEQLDSEYGEHAKFFALLGYVQDKKERGEPVDKRLEQIQMVTEYIAEVNNGGHSQFFFNQGVNVVPGTLEGLRIYFPELVPILECATAHYEKSNIAEPDREKGIDAYVEFAGSLNLDVDSAFFDLVEKGPEEIISEKIASELDQWVFVFDPAEMDLHGYLSAGEGQLKDLRYDQLQLIEGLTDNDIAKLDSVIVSSATNELKWSVLVLSCAMKEWNERLRYEIALKRFAAMRMRRMILTGVLAEEQYEHQFPNGSKKMVQGIRLAQ